MYKNSKQNKSKILAIFVISFVVLSLNVQLISSRSLTKHNFDRYLFHEQHNSHFLNPEVPPSSPDARMKKIVQPNDEGSHNNSVYKYQEWWYFNGIIMSPTSLLNNWSFMISFNKMKTVDIFFSTLYDDKNKSYGGSIWKWPGSIEAEPGPGLNVTYEDKSYAIGSYPDWFIHVENNKEDEKNITYNLNYHANSKPHWIFLNSGKNKKDSLLGHYSILNCSITGDIIIDGEKYDVSGYGYHEHHWFTYINELKKQKQEKELLKKDDKNDLEHKLNVWDWYYICLDNGWNLFIGNILQDSKIGKIMPDLMWLTPDGENFSKCLYFKLDYINTTNTSLENIKIPEKVNIKGFFLSTLLKNPLKGIMFIDIVIENLNVREMTFGFPPTTGVWEGTCKINGKIGWGFNKVNVKGRGIVELTRG